MSGSMSASTPRPPAGVARAASGGAGGARGIGVLVARRAGNSGAPAPAPPTWDDGFAWAGGWPLRDAVQLGALPGAVPCARLHVRQVLWEWGLATLIEGAELLASELVTNAIAASRAWAPAAPVGLWLLSDRTRVLILVWDASPRPPVPAAAGWDAASADAESGRGLLLVEAISEQWDWYFPRDASGKSGGKVVWAALRMG